jgi:lipopolysaccharide export system ATP-binding protein
MDIKTSQPEIPPQKKKGLLFAAGTIGSKTTGYETIDSKSNHFAESKRSEKGVEFSEEAKHSIKRGLLFAAETERLLVQEKSDSKISFDLHTLGVRDLHKKFGKKAVVKGVNFTMNNGEVAGLLGPNGAGKTTIFYMIVGFYTPTKGTVIMDDIDITSKPMYRRARLGIAYLPQEASIFRKLTVEQNIWAILESRSDLTKDQKIEKLENLLSEFSIGRIRSQF